MKWQCPRISCAATDGTTDTMTGGFDNAALLPTRRKTWKATTVGNLLGLSHVVPLLSSFSMNYGSNEPLINTY